MKKLLATVTTILIFLISVLQGTPTGEALSTFFGNLGAQIGVGVIGYGGLFLVALNEYIKKKSGKDIARSFLASLSEKNEESENLMKQLLGTEIAQQLFVKRDEFIADKKSLFETAYLDKKLELFNLLAKIGSGLLTSDQEAEAHILVDEIQKWLDENSTETT